MIPTNKEIFSWKIPTTLTFIFALLCVPGLNVPLHGDEAVTYLEHSASHAIVGPNQHTLFTILSNIAMRFLGEHEITFRLPVFLAAIISIFFIHYLGARLWSGRVAIIASLLMMSSFHHFYWAQHGRGYALTELLALSSVFGIILLLDGKKNKQGTLMLIFSGFALCLTQPSNVYFLPGCGLAVIFVLWESRDSKIPVSWSLFKEKLLPFLFLMVLTAGFFSLIYDDLIWGMETYKNLLQLRGAEIGGTPKDLYQIVHNLARPWGLWFYLPVLYGLWALNKIQRGFFLILIGTPALLTFASGIVGPPRVYVYVLPFFILLAALGVDRGIHFLFRSTVPDFFKKMLSVALGLVLLIPSILSHAQNYLDAREIKYATMAESLEALRYIRNQTSEHDLLVISIEDMALRRNLEPLIAKRMLRVLQDGRLDGIVFLGHRNISANHIVDTIKLPPSSTDFLMRVEVDIGKMRIYRMNVNVTPLFPLEPDMSFSQQWGKFRNPKLSETENPTHSFLGQKSLQINKNVKEDVLVYSPSTNNISSEGRSFVFYGYAKKYQQKSKAGLLVRESPPPVLLNGLFGIFREKKNDLIWEWIHPHFFIISDRLKDKEPFKWEIMLTLLPLNSGLNEIKKSLFLKDQISYFDGFQGYLLTPKEKK